jgi:hypothetical protein
MMGTISSKISSISGATGSGDVDAPTTQCSGYPH